MQKRIQKMGIVWNVDTDPDLSYLGTFDHTAKSSLAVRHHSNNFRALPWFNPQPGTCENKKQAQETYNRMVGYISGDWQMESCKAIATIETSADGKVWLINTVKSSGLYGIESDIDETEKRAIEAEQLAEVADALEAFGFTRDEITDHFEL